jgi:hypothetical protein
LVVFAVMVAAEAAGRDAALNKSSRDGVRCREPEGRRRLAGLDVAARFCCCWGGTAPAPAFPVGSSDVGIAGLVAVETTVVETTAVETASVETTAVEITASAP